MRSVPFPPTVPIRLVLLVLFAVLVSCGGTLRADEFASRWHTSPDRVWIGPEYFANRLQDWRLAAGRVECLETRKRFPMRTLHLLTHSLKSAAGDFSLRVRTGGVGEGAPDAWVGFLVGSGGDHVDHRLTAMVHHQPAEDGGLLAVMQGDGTLAFRDFSRRADTGGLWTLNGPLAPVPELDAPPTRSTGAKPGGVLELRLEGRAAATGYVLTLSTHDPSGGEVSRREIRGVSPSLVDGGIALVSHLAPGKGAHWFERWHVSGSKVAAHADRELGPVICTQHTLSRGTLKLTAQMAPIGSSEPTGAALQVRDGDAWKTVATGNVIRGCFTIPFRVEGWDGSREQAYRIVYPSDGETPSAYAGVIPAEPSDDDVVVAAFTGHKVYTGGLKWNHGGVWFPHQDLVSAVAHHRPDFLFFSGDQVYEGDLTLAQHQPQDVAMLDYLYKWYRWCWAFRELTRRTPSVCIPDDHDVYHGNIWGAAGKATEGGMGSKAQDTGGYKMSPGFVNAVHRTQTSHLPDPHDPTPVLQGISVYYTRIEYGGVSFAVIADRQWKSSPTVAVPDGRCKNGWFQNPDFDPAREADVPGAVLLGQRQLDFLREWSTDFSSGAWMKVVLSQTIFANVATLPKEGKSDAIVPRIPYYPAGIYPENHKLAADADSNGWPQTGRNRALREIRRGFALHIAGDQHLGSTIQYGIDGWRDAGFAFCVPSVANTWPRRWFPPAPGRGRDPSWPRYAGDFLDGFGNHITVRAVSNPHQSGREPSRLHDRAPGYGIVRLNRKTRDIVIECWPRWANPALRMVQQYPGWPIRVNQWDNYAPEPAAWLPTVKVRGLSEPVVQVQEVGASEIEYAIRWTGTTFQPPVYRPGRYRIRVGDPDAGLWKSFEVEAHPQQSGAGVVEAVFGEKL